MDPVKNSGERVEVAVSADKAKATLYLGRKPIMTVEVVCALGDWASGTEGIVAGLEGLIICVRRDAPKHGIQIRPSSFARPERA